MKSADETFDLQHKYTWTASATHLDGSLNPDIDISHVEGAFVMGLGYWLTEKLIYDSKTGALLSHGTKEYNPSCSKDIPVCFKTELLKDAPNPTGVLRSKANGKPP
ncbi:UNVERIFIED_CONTAM: hypothetical protein FKN15_054657 [Acipenser sinensis]